jgi:hypothetical protein
MSIVTDHITKSPGICGGDACIRGTRIPVWTLVGYRRLELSDTELVAALSLNYELATLNVGEFSRVTNLRLVDVSVYSV